MKSDAIKGVTLVQVPAAQKSVIANSMQLYRSPDWRQSTTFVE